MVCEDKPGESRMGEVVTIKVDIPLADNCVECGRNMPIRMGIQILFDLNKIS